MTSNAIDRSKVIINRKKGFQFTPFRPKQGIDLQKAKLPVDMELLVFEQVGERRALVMREMAYHHVAQGKVANKPYLVSF